MAGPSLSTGNGHAREWRPVHLVYLAAAAIILFVVVFWSALGQPPFSGITVEWVLGGIFTALANVSLGALASGAVIEYRYPRRSRLGLLDHIFMAIAIVALLGADVGVGIWLFASTSGALSQWLFVIIALAAIALGAWLAWHPPPIPPVLKAGGGEPRQALWPHHDPDAPETEQWGPFTPLTMLLGGALGVAVAVAYLGISAWHENVDVPAGHPMPAALANVHGSYLALGDSYSAGEGLPPFADGTAVTACDRSVNSAYPTLLSSWLGTSGSQVPLTFTACSGALVSEILKPAHRPGGLVQPQISGVVQPSVGLVTLTIGGNNAIFSKVVTTCLTAGRCLQEAFPPPNVAEATAGPIPRGPLLAKWGPGTIEEIGTEDAAVFRELRHDFPNARIVVIGYPYLFPKAPAPGFPYIPPACASILNRLSADERAGIRTLQDEFNDRIYEEAVAAGVEYVSPAKIWDDHEPCGTSGQYTNSVKPYLNFPNPINGGSFHPNAAGQQTLAALLGCYLDEYPNPPDPFPPGAPRAVTIPAASLASPSQLSMAPPPGVNSVPGAGTIPNC
jgi:lysophospholipase L1-like esterase